MTNDENIQTLTPEFLSRPQGQHSPYKWMDENEEFFYELIAERTNTTKTLTKTSYRRNRAVKSRKHPKCLGMYSKKFRHPTKELRVTPTKELSSTPLPQRPHKPKVVMRDLNEGKSTPASATRELKPKNFFVTSRIKNRRWHPLH